MNPFSPLPVSSYVFQVLVGTNEKLADQAELDTKFSYYFACACHCLHTPIWTRPPDSGPRVQG